MSGATESMFQIKYEEFSKEIESIFPELASEVAVSRLLSSDEKLKRFCKEVTSDPTDYTMNPHCMLPDVFMPETIWSTLSESNKKVIWEYIRMLKLCSFMEGGEHSFGEGEEFKMPEWIDDTMKTWKDKLNTVDFASISEKIMKFFQSENNVETPESAGEKGTEESKGAFPNLPPKFLKGHLAKLAEELVKSLKPDDLGLTPEMIKDCEENPMKSFDILLKVFTTNPEAIQKTIQKIGKRLQQKIQTGQINPKQIVSEAEELIKNYVNNPAFVELMESIKSAFGFEDLGLARQAGREGSARLAIVKDRLRKKLEKRKAAGASG
jgi:hypothetical protein